MRKQFGKISMSRSPRRRFSPQTLATIIVPAILVLIAGVTVATSLTTSSFAKGGKHKHQQQQHQPRKKQQAQQQPQVINCTLTVPVNPLSAQGLATPYQLGNGCHEGNPMQAAFVQGAVIDPATGQISIYNPLVIDQGTQPAVQPTSPQLPPNGIVALWFGFNGNTLTLQDTNGQCVSGVAGSPFGQVSYCNAPAFFTAANQAIQAGKLTIPALGTGQDGKACPTVRDFSVVDQDQSDNVTSDYLVSGNGQTAQLTTANAAAFPNATNAANGSDNRLLDTFIDGALKCTPWMAPDLANPGHMVPAQPLNELQAAAQQAAPVALVPLGDPMTLVNNNPNQDKTNLYRMGVDQPAVGVSDGGDTTTYCQNLLNIAPSRIATDAPLTGVQASPDPAAANSLFTFLAQRFQTTFEGPLGTGLACAPAGQGPIQAQKDANGVAISATITVNGQTQCFDMTGNKVAMTVCMNNANAMNKANNNNGMNQQQGQQNQMQGQQNQGTQGQGQQGKRGKSRKHRQG
jgi:hypothetical protein